MTNGFRSSQPIWHTHEVGLGSVEIDQTTAAAELVRLVKRAPSLQNQPLFYSNAQIDDYRDLRRTDFLWRPPVYMKLRARFSHSAFDESKSGAIQTHMTGTAGFGFWNDPFMMTGSRVPTLPRAIWFFYSSPPSNMELAMHVPGRGWKAGVIDCHRLGFYALLPTAPIGVLLMRSPLLYRWLWPIAQGAMTVDESLVEENLTEWRTYEIEWLPNRARFWVDDALILDTHRSPKGPLGMVIWLDNQSMVVTPMGQFRSGLVASKSEECLEIEGLEVTASRR